MCYPETYQYCFGTQEAKWDDFYLDLKVNHVMNTWVTKSRDEICKSDIDSQKDNNISSRWIKHVAQISMIFKAISFCAWI